MRENLKTLLLSIIIALSFFCSKAIAENYPYRSNDLWVTVPDHADWLYHTGEKAKVDVGFYLYGIPQDVELLHPFSTFIRSIDVLLRWLSDKDGQSRRLFFSERCS